MKCITIVRSTRYDLNVETTPMPPDPPIDAATAIDAAVAENLRPHLDAASGALVDAIASTVRDALDDLGLDPERDEAARAYANAVARSLVVRAVRDRFGV